MNEKKEDEIFCPECGKVVKRNAIICPFCRVQIKQKENIEKEKKHWISNACWAVGGLAVIALAYISLGNPLITLATGIALVILYSILIKRYRKN